MGKSFSLMLLAGSVLISSASAADSDGAWSRGEGMRACLKNCNSKIPKAASASQAQRQACKERCTCIIEGMFEPGGKAKRDQKDLAKVAAECKKRLSLGAAPPEQAAPSSVVISANPVGADRSELLPGTDCSKAPMPSLQYEPGGHRIRLSQGGFKMTLPKGWSATLDRPDLVLISATASVKGVRPVFEMFVSPVCKSYDGLSVNRRVAGRGLSELLPASATAEQVKKGSWTVGLGGLVGQNLVLNDVTVKTGKGDRTVVLYSTQLGESKNFGLHAAAICPKKEAKDGKWSACEQTYFDMLGKAEF